MDKQLETTSTPASQTPAADHEKGSRLLRKIPWYGYVIIILSIAVVGVWGWKEIALRSQKTKLIEQTNEIIAQKTDEFLALSGQSLTWAVRAEMIRENYDRIDEYSTEIVKHPGVNLFAVVLNDGKIRIASDKLLEGQSASQALVNVKLDVSTLTTQSAGDGMIYVVSPVFGLSERLGTVILRHKTTTDISSKLDR